MKSWRARIAAWRNRRLSDPAFHDFAASFPFTRPIARRRARALFDITAGFVYSQILFACAQLRVFDILADGPMSIAAFARQIDVPRDGAERLARAGDALDLLEFDDGAVQLGAHGAALLGNRSVLGMILHHSALYRDLADPVALLRRRSDETRLAKFWDYSGDDDVNTMNLGEAGGDYSTLMAETQAFIAEEVLHAYDFSRHRRLLDVGGGAGAFLCAAKKRHDALSVAVCDLPPVAEKARQRFADAGVDATATACDFRHDPLPAGADIITLIRVLHDHDDDLAAMLLAKIRQALAPGGALLIAEPLAKTPGAAPMGEAYFGFYLWAMGSGRPRSFDEIRAMTKAAGFADAKLLRTRRPIFTQAILVRA